MEDHNGWQDTDASLSVPEQCDTWQSHTCPSKDNTGSVFLPPHEDGCVPVSKGTSEKKRENLPHTRRPRAETTRSLGSIFKRSQDTNSESYQQSWGVLALENTDSYHDCAKCTAPCLSPYSPCASSGLALGSGFSGSPAHLSCSIDMRSLMSIASRPSPQSLSTAQETPAPCSEYDWY